MRFLSTRRSAPPASLSEVLLRGTAPDGGLYVPEALPEGALAGCRPGRSLPETAEAVLGPFFEGDPLLPELPALCQAAFDLPAPLVPLGEEAFLLELFHGPTSAFKDFGARFLAACLRTLEPSGNPHRTVLVATSGDTGSAVASAFHGQPGVRVVLLYPDGRVSPRQAHQLGCFGDNVTALRVAGSFDDCQRMVKAAFADPGLAGLRLTSANSISLGRLLPQMAYHAHAAFLAGELNLVVPTGNLGNALAAVWARALGAPIGEVVLATNANRVLPEYFATGTYRPRPSVTTLANAMDVGDPSNFERLLWTLPDPRAAGASLSTETVEDREIRGGHPGLRAALRPGLLPSHRDRGAGAGAATEGRSDWTLGGGGHRAPGEVRDRGRAPHRSSGPGASGAGGPPRPTRLCRGIPGRRCFVPQLAARPGLRTQFPRPTAAPRLSAARRGAAPARDGMSAPP